MISNREHSNRCADMRRQAYEREQARRRTHALAWAFFALVTLSALAMAFSDVARPKSGPGVPPATPILLDD